MRRLVVALSYRGEWRIKNQNKAAVEHYGEKALRQDQVYACTHDAIQPRGTELKGDINYIDGNQVHSFAYRVIDEDEV